MQEKAKRQYTFDFLLGDIGKNGRRRRLPVDAFYESRKLVIEYWEKQHFESVPIYNKNTISGERDKQRRIYDQRRKELLPKNGINLIIIPYYDFKHRSNGKLIRDYNKDIAVVKKSLCNYL